MDVQIFINSTVFVFFMIRFASVFLSKTGWWKLFIFLLVVMGSNFAMMIDKFYFQIALYKSIMIALGFLVGVVVMARAKRNKLAKR